MKLNLVKANINTIPDGSRIVLSLRKQPFFFAYRKDVLYVNAEMIDNIMERMGCRVGRPIGTPTVKELIAVLSKLPEDYRVTCCGADNFLYLFPQSKAITIDCDRFIG